MTVNAATFFQFYMFHSNLAPKKRDRIITLVSSIALGVFSLGLAHIFCYAAFYNRKLSPISEKSATEAKTDKVFEEKVNSAEAESSSEEPEPSEEPIISTPKNLSGPLGGVRDGLQLADDIKTQFEAAAKTQKPPTDKPEKDSAQEATSSQKTPHPRRRSVIFRDRPKKGDDPHCTESKRDKLKRFFSLKNVRDHLHCGKGNEAEEASETPKEATQAKRKRTKRRLSFKNLKERISHKK